MGNVDQWRGIFSPGKADLTQQYFVYCKKNCAAVSCSLAVTSHAALAFSQTEAPRYFHTLAFVYMRLPFVWSDIFLRPAERWAGEPNMALLAICQIVPVPVYLIRENPLGIMPFALIEALCYLL